MVVVATTVVVGETVVGETVVGETVVGVSGSSAESSEDPQADATSARRMKRRRGSLLMTSTVEITYAIRHRPDD